MPREDQRREIGSDRYFGGVVYPAHASLHPAKYHQGLLARAQAAGAQVISHCPVLSIQRDSEGFRLTSPRGTLQARDVLVATNGYTGTLTPWLRRRVIPIGSYIIATEMLDPALAKRLSPNNRVLSDTRKLVFYYRLSEDRRRMVFGGRVAFKETDPRQSAPKLHAHMTRIFPELAPVKITHSWMGFVAYTFDTLPHLGRQEDGIYYCMGYCGSGVSLASYFGTRVAQQILGRPEGRTALDGIQFQTRPLYNGDPWFLATRGRLLQAAGQVEPVVSRAADRAIRSGRTHPFPSFPRKRESRATSEIHVRPCIPAFAGIRFGGEAASTRSNNARSSAPRLKERAQQLTRRPLADAAIDLRAMVAGRLGEEARAMLDGAALGIAGAEIEPAQPGEGDRRRAHGAGLQRDIEIGPLQPLQPRRGRRRGGSPASRHGPSDPSAPPPDCRSGPGSPRWRRPPAPRRPAPRRARRRPRPRPGPDP